MKNDPDSPEPSGWKRLPNPGGLGCRIFWLLSVRLWMPPIRRLRNQGAAWKLSRSAGMFANAEVSLTERNDGL